MKWTVRAVVLSGLFALVPMAPASAQPYPIPPVTPCISTPSPVDLGTHNVGETFGTSVCGPWLTGQKLSFNFNGFAAGGKNTNADGSVPAVFSILSLNAVNVDDIVPGRCGQNVLTITGLGSPTGASLSKQVTFNLNCNQFGQPFVPSSFFPGGVFPGVGSYPGVGSFSVPGSPGLVIAPSQTSSQQEQQQQQSVSVPAGGSGGAAPAAAAPAAAAQGRVAFTGANVVRWSIAALALMGVGALLVLHSRRRRPLLGS